MRSQVYEWDAADYGTGVALPAPGRSVSIFVGGFGNNITKPAETTATEFVVIEDIAITPTASASSLPTTPGTTAYRGLIIATAGIGLAGPRAYVQVRINTTDYFLDPDNVPNDGIPGTGSPYPRSVNFQPSFNLYPDVYVLPGQVWDILTVYYTQTGVGDSLGEVDSGDYRAFTKYTLYDGPDALIANKLLEMGISINPGNVDWYKRSLLSA
jgi:hypothetical protein